jgi:two-component system phosphate regulon response regulator PhoB
MSSILVVEDEPDLASLIAFNLTQAHFNVDVAYTGESALERANNSPPHLVILDLMLPDISGIEVCKQLRQRRNVSYVPVLMLTAKREEADRVAGFESGADDYLTKPFSVQELILRVKAILRRAGTTDEGAKRISFGLLELDTLEHRCFVEGKLVSLTLLEFRLLQHLLLHPGKVQSREKLLEEVWKLQGSLETRTIDTHINRLRQKLAEARDYLETVRGIGYRISIPE